MTGRRGRTAATWLLAVALAAAPVQLVRAAPALSVGPPFAVTVSLSPKAAARLARSRETIVVNADFYGDSSGRAPRLENEVGQIVLSRSQKIELHGAGAARFHGPRYDKARLADIDEHGFQVLINVFTGRRSSADNLLDCGFFQAAIEVAARGVPIHCKLIGE